MYFAEIYLQESGKKWSVKPISRLKTNFYCSKGVLKAHYKS